MWGARSASAGHWRVACSCARCVSAGLRAAAPLTPPGCRGRGALPGAGLHQPLAQVRRLREPGQLSSVGSSFVPELSFLPSVLSTSYVTGVHAARATVFLLVTQRSVSSGACVHGIGL